jgi:DNA repair photolyase
MSVTVEEIAVARALTPTGGFLRGFTHTLNAYGGCAFACTYCYVQELPVARYSPLAGQGWGTWARPKINLPGLLRAELERLAARGKLHTLRIFMSSATDPYQPLERRYELTRRCLELLTEFPPGWLVVQTRSPLVVRDLGLLQRLGRRAMVSVTVETDSEEVRRAISPRAPSLPRRHAAMAQLRAAGVYVQAAISPLLPCDPRRLAAQLAPLCDRALLDTYVLGDGAGGKHTARLGIPELYARLGWGDWCHPPLHAVADALIAHLGPERVVWSQAGFTTVPPGYGAVP